MSPFKTVIKVGGAVSPYRYTTTAGNSSPFARGGAQNVSINTLRLFFKIFQNWIRTNKNCFFPLFTINELDKVRPFLKLLLRLRVSECKPYCLHRNIYPPCFLWRNSGCA